MEPNSRAYADAASPLTSGSRDAPATLLLHGLGGDRRQLWGAEASPRFQLPFTIASDARLHGDSTIEAPTLDFRTLAYDQLTLLDRMGIEGRVLLVGVSMGAATCLRMCEIRPDRVAGAVLIRPAWAAAASPENLEILIEIGELLESHGEEAGRQAFVESTRYRRLRRESPSAAKSALNQFSKPLAAARSRRLRDIPRAAPLDSPADFAGIDVPVLILPMPDDPLHPMSIARELAALIPHAQIAELPSRDRFPRKHELELDVQVERFANRVGIPGR